MKEFPFSKKFTSMGSKHQLNPTLVFFFFAFLKKITTTGSSHFLSPNGQGLNVLKGNVCILLFDIFDFKILKFDFSKYFGVICNFRFYMQVVLMIFL